MFGTLYNSYRRIAYRFLMQPSLAFLGSISNMKLSINPSKRVAYPTLPLFQRRFWFFAFRVIFNVRSFPLFICRKSVSRPFCSHCCSGKAYEKVKVICFSGRCGQKYMTVISIVHLYLIPLLSSSFLPVHFHCLIHQRFPKRLNISFRAADW